MVTLTNHVIAGPDLRRAGPLARWRFCNIFLPNVGEDQYLNCKILHGGTLLQP